MNCDEILELLSPSLDGELSPQQEATVQAHLAHCPQCRVLMAELTAIREGCEGLDAAPPPELTQRILQNLPAQSASKPAKLLYWKRWGAMAAAVALIALAAWRMPGILQSHDAVVPAVAGETNLDPEVSEAFDATGQASDMPKTVTTAGNGGQPVPNPQLPDYVYDEIVSANAVSPGSGPVSGADAAVAPDTGAEAAKEYGATHFKMGDTANSGGAKSLPSAAPSPSSISTYTRLAFTGATDDALPKSTVPEAAESEGALALLSVAVHGDGLSPLDTDNGEILEEAPPMSEDERGIATVELEEVYQVSALPATYCGILTLRQGVPVGSYPAQIQADGAIWYTLPADDFNALLRELDEQSFSYELRLEGEDISSSARQGLLIVTG